MIRPARREDAATARQLVQDAYGCYVSRIGTPPGPMLDDYAQRIAAGQVWLLEEGGAVLGLLVLEDTPRAFILDNVAVSPSAQGRGYGPRLVAFAEDEARRRGHGLLELYTNELMVENLALYARLGFRETGRRSEQGYKRVYMAKVLA